MIQFMSYADNYFEIFKSTGYKTVIYGAGLYAKRAFPYLKNVSVICDKRADEIKKLNDIAVVRLTEIEKINEKLMIVICIKSEAVRSQIKAELEKSSVNALVFDYFDNIAFDLYEQTACMDQGQKKELHNIRLICEDNGWIIGKFAKKMKEELEKQGYVCSIGDGVDPYADINHHVIYASCYPVTPHYNETFMITHIDSGKKLALIKAQLKKVSMGICMSRETMERLAAYGIPREKLCYVNPAQDGVIKPKKYILGITHKTHEDHRKNEGVLIELCRALDPAYFSFKIMGAGWNDIVADVREMGFQVDYYKEFDYEIYIQLMPSLDFYLYWGFDEGSMGYLDALRAGVGTIVTPQGYHLDIKDGITYACRTIPDFKNVLLELQEKRKRIVRSVESWNWENYVNKHVEIWNYLLGNEENIYKNQHMYEDGIFSVMRCDA